MTNVLLCPKIAKKRQKSLNLALLIIFLYTLSKFLYSYSYKRGTLCSAYNTRRNMIITNDTLCTHFLRELSLIENENKQVNKYHCHWDSNRRWRSNTRTGQETLWLDHYTTEPVKYILSTLR